MGNSKPTLAAQQVQRQGSVNKEILSKNNITKSHNFLKKSLFFCILAALSLCDIFKFCRSLTVGYTESVFVDGGKKRNQKEFP